MNCTHGWENERGEPAPCYECLAAENERLKAALRRISETDGCECDTFEGHTCVLCRVRRIADDALEAA